MPSPVEIIKERLSIAEVIGSYIKLDKAGINLKAKCPFHNERTPSFFVSPTRGTFYCFGCGAKGDIFSFVQTFEGLDFMGSLKMLAARAGVEIAPEDPKVRGERDRLLGLLEAATVFYQRNLNANADARSYLLKRGLEEATISEWRLGFAPDDWREFLEHARGMEYTEGETEKAGLVKKEKGKSYDRFRNRIMFPLFDSAGRIVAFSGRILGKESSNVPKYLNSPETPIFSKSRVLYGFDRAKKEIRRLNYTILVEGQMDLLMCHQAGFKNAVATSGTAFTQNHLDLLRRLSNRLLMVFDADSAGVKASLRAATLALAAGMEVKIAALPKGTDPAELIRTDAAVWKYCLRSSKHVIDFYLDEIMKEGLEGVKLSRAIRDRLLSFVASLESSIERDHFISQISKRTGIREAAIAEDLKKVKVDQVPNEGSAAPSEQKVLTARRHLVERLLLGLLLYQERIKQPIFDALEAKKEIERILGEDSKEIFKEAAQIREELVYQAEVYYGKKENYEREVSELLSTLEEDVVKDRLSESLHELSAAEGAKDKKKIDILLKRCQTLTTRLNAIKSAAL